MQSPPLRRNLCGICNNGNVRRLLASSLLALLLAPSVLPLFGQRAVESSLPACCRRNGKHHCMMYMAWIQQRAFRTIRAKCPYDLAPPAVIVFTRYAPSAPATLFTRIRRQPAAIAQPEPPLRASFDRTRQKRGPPAQIA